MEKTKPQKDLKSEGIELFKKNKMNFYAEILRILEESETPLAPYIKIYVTVNYSHKSNPYFRFAIQTEGWHFTDFYPANFKKNRKWNRDLDENGNIDILVLAEKDLLNKRLQWPNREFS